MIYTGKEIQMKIDIETYDIDIAGHVNNIVFIRWLEKMRTRLLAGIVPFPKLLDKNIYPVVISTEAKYKKLIKLFDKPVGSMMLGYYSHGLMILNAAIKVNNITVFSAVQKCVLIDLKSNKMICRKVQDLLISKRVQFV